MIRKISFPSFFLNFLLEEAQDRKLPINTVITTQREVTINGTSTNYTTKIGTQPDGKSAKYWTWSMAKKALPEILWTLLAVALAFLISYFLGINLFSEGSTFDINIYDTYFVIAEEYVLCFVFFLFLFLIYLTRNFMNKFKSFPAYLVSIISSGALIIFFTFIHTFIGFTQTSFPHSSFDPESTSGGFATNLPADIMEHNSAWANASTVLLLLQIAILIYIIYASYRYGKSISTS